jgi:hypothetical protein
MLTIIKARHEYHGSIRVYDVIQVNAAGQRTTHTHLAHNAQEISRALGLGQDAKKRVYA